MVFARRVARLAEVTAVTATRTAARWSTGSPASCFLASSNELVGRFAYATDPDRVVIDLSAAHVRDASSVAAPDTVGTKFSAPGPPPRPVSFREAPAAGAVLPSTA